jgi:hypothetical protein
MWNYFFAGLATLLAAYILIAIRITTKSMPKPPRKSVVGERLYTGIMCYGCFEYEAPSTEEMCEACRFANYPDGVVQYQLDEETK